MGFNRVHTKMHNEKCYSCVSYVDGLNRERWGERWKMSYCCIWSGENIREVWTGQNLVFWPHCVAYGILVLQPGIKPASSALEATVLNTGPLGNSPELERILTSKEREDVRLGMKYCSRSLALVSLERWVKNVRLRRCHRLNCASSRFICWSLSLNVTCK